MFKNRFLLVLAFIAIFLFVVFFSPEQALAQGTDDPVVFGVLLYSSSCSHCHAFITNDWPVMHEEFGDQFQLMFINVNSEAGSQLGAQVYEYYGIPEGERYVPMMMIGDQVFIGGYDIPNAGGEYVRQGLASGGIPLADVPGLKEAYAQAVASSQANTEESSSAEESSEAAEEPADNPGEEEESSGIVTEAEDVNTGVDITDMTVMARIKRDLAGNLIAIVVLLGLVASLGAVLVTTASGAEDAAGWLAKSPAWVISLIVALAGLGISITLLSSTQGELLPTVAALFIMLSYLTITVVIFRARPKGTSFNVPDWLFPVAMVAGLAVALYLSYVEVNQVEPVCGAVGDCGTVQSSPYATLFGILSVGVLGVIGNVAMLIAWFMGQLGKGTVSDLGWAGLFGMAIFGTAFSIYLTFLEPFVIGATCAWCVTSAITMMLLLWFSAERGLKSTMRLLGG